MSSAVSTTAVAQSVFSAQQYSNDGKKHLLLGASGSVATIKIPNIVNALSQVPNLSILIVLTKSASAFLAGQSREQPDLAHLSSVANVDGIFVDEDEWAHPWQRGNPILHIELRRWAHVLVIAPLSANTLAKITGGFSDNLLTSVVRAWDTSGTVDVITVPPTLTKKVIIVAPAMNTAMWKHPITEKQINTLQQDWGIQDEERGDEQGWFEVLRPQEKELACGDVGVGAMVAWEEIVRIVKKRLGLV